MTYLFNDPAEFAAESRAGFIAANAHRVRGVTGGVVRADVPSEPQVALVIGGGTGHYPAFAGLVGDGLAAGAVMGNLFASPSSQQAFSVARAAQQGKGVLFSYGNYAGDVLNFDRAQLLLRDAGIPCETVVVTDDLSSASQDEIERRRGIAGGFFVFKVAGAAIAEGLDLRRVTEIAQRANGHTRTLGVAFSGCTFPGATEPLFTVPEGVMAVGMGIHGERGIRDSGIPTANELADMLVSGLLEEAPADAGDHRLALILNGLGSVKYEELFVVYNRVAARLQDEGLDVVEPEVGELVTSFEMAGASLTLSWLDDELEHFWRAPAQSPAYRKGSVRNDVLERRPSAAAGDEEHVETQRPVANASKSSRAAAITVVRALEIARHTIEANKEELGRLDAIAGDGDHGIGMERGVTAALDAARSALSDGAGAGATLRCAADAWADTAGGTSGALWGLGLSAIADAIGDTAKPSIGELLAGLRDARAQIEKFGKAKQGDKTMLDALVPLIEALGDGASGGRDRWASAAGAARAGAAGTSDMLPRVGRARPHAEQSLGTPDPGAVSLAAIASDVIEELSANE